ncbi:MAG: hypothetical protein ACP5J4_11020 [Anaerolineae bacterium]
MIEREFYINTQFERFARLLEDVTSRYPKPDIFPLGKRGHLTLQGAYSDYSHGRVVITGGLITEDETGNIINAHPNLNVIVFHAVAVRETRLKVTARCGFKNVLVTRFEELLNRIQEAYPEAQIVPLEHNVKARAVLMPWTVLLLQRGRELDPQYPGALAWHAEYCGFTMEEAEELLALYESGQLPPSEIELLEQNAMNVNSSPDYKRRARENRQAHLIEEFEAVTAQISRELSDGSRKRLERQLADLERQITEIDVQLQGASTSEPLPTANPLAPEPPVLAMARRALTILQTQAGAYAASAIPVHLQLDLEEKRKQVEDLEARWRAGKL